MPGSLGDGTEGSGETAAGLKAERPYVRQVRKWAHGNARSRTSGCLVREAAKSSQNFSGVEATTPSGIFELVVGMVRRRSTPGERFQKVALP